MSTIGEQPQLPSRDIHQEEVQKSPCEGKMAGGHVASNQAKDDHLQAQIPSQKVSEHFKYHAGKVDAAYLSTLESEKIKSAALHKQFHTDDTELSHTETAALGHLLSIMVQLDKSHAASMGSEMMQSFIQKMDDKIEPFLKSDDKPPVLIKAQELREALNDYAKLYTEHQSELTSGQNLTVPFDQLEASRDRVLQVKSDLIQELPSSSNEPSVREIKNLLEMMSVSKLPSDLPMPQDKLELAKEKSNEILQYAFANDSLNTRLQSSQDAQGMAASKSFLLRYSHLTKRFDEYENVFNRVQSIEKKLSLGEEIKEEEKVTPKEARLIMSMGKLLPDLEKLEVLGIRTAESHQIHVMGRYLEEKIKQISHQGWDEASLFVHHGMEELEHSYHATLKSRIMTRLKEIVTGGPAVHGAAIYPKNQELRVSHIQGEHLNEPLDVTAESYAKAYKVDVEALMSGSAIQKAKDVYGTDWKKEATKIWLEVSRDFHEEVTETQENRRWSHEEITNQYRRQIKSAFLPHKKVWGEDHTLDLEIPKEKNKEICSEFVARSMIAVTNRFNLVLKAKINAAIEIEQKDTAPFKEDERAAIFPIDSRTKMSNISPAYLIKKWGRSSRKKEQNPLHHKAIFIPIESGEYGQYFHVPKA